MKGYKALKKGMICDPTGKKPFQFAENTEYEVDGDAKMCENGFHFCENPRDTLNYYPLIDIDGNLTEFAEVEADEDAVKRDGNKLCAKKIKVGAKLSLAGFIKASFDFIFHSNSGEASSGNYSKLASSGYNSQLASSGDCSTITSTGKECVICNIGVSGKARAAKGSYITLAEYLFQNDAFYPLCVKTEYVDGEKIKENVLYELKNGEFTEAEKDHDNEND